MRALITAALMAGLVVPLTGSARAEPAPAAPAPTPAPPSVPTPQAAGLPGLQHELDCTKTAIKEIGNRLLGTPGSGSAVSYTNGGFQVGYDELPEISRARVGDPVFMCLIAIPKQCPPGDARGRVYTATDLRTQESWTLADSSHACGGA